MDISARAWLIVIGVLIIAAVLLDGYRRMRKNNRIDFGQMTNFDDKDLDSSELPNGGARVVTRDDLDNDDFDDAEYDFGDIDDVEERQPAIQSASSRNIAKEQPEKQTHARKSVDELFVINVIAKENQRFDGEDLLSVLLDAQLRFGEMDIFHYFEENESDKKIFSVANAVEPGVFNLDNINEYSTPGLSFFMTLPGPQNPLQAFDKMLECAKNVAEDLRADLKDSDHNLLTSQSSMHDRQRIEDYIRKSFRANPD